MAREMATKTTQKPRTGIGSALGRARAAQQVPAKTVTQQGSLSTWGRLKRYLREVKVEMGKVTWPGRKWSCRLPRLFSWAVVIASAYIGVLDLIGTISSSSSGSGRAGLGRGRLRMDPKWYVINTYSGHENKARANLEHRNPVS